MNRDRHSCNEDLSLGCSEVLDGENQLSQTSPNVAMRR